LGLAVARAIEAALAQRDARLRVDLDLLDEIWAQRPGLPQEAIFEHGERFAPLSRAARLDGLRNQMRLVGADWHLISSLDDVAWLLNLRGADVPYNPVFLAHVLVGPRSASLFVADGKLSGELAARLRADGIEVVDYAQAEARVAAVAPGSSLLIDPRRVTLKLVRAVAPGVRLIEHVNPTTLSKSRKTEAEIAHVRSAMEHDGAALCEFFAWFEAALGRGEAITELTIDEKVTAARARRPGFVSPSFATIAGFNANGAAPHYRATEESHAAIAGDGLLLIDSGGQYESGTTDITRVVAVGSTTPEQRRDFTLVLKGMIQLARAQFPRGTRSPLLDSLARAPIWSAGIDYGHGTGHGVGYFLNVHEGPHGITPYLAPEPQTAMEPGMITSDEPGIYRPGRWGVRIENLLLTVPAGRGEFGEFLKFETLTLCPIDARCIEVSMLRADEVEWLDAYNEQVGARLAPHVSGDALRWLQLNTRPIGKGR
ncbi:MAG TPA: aminopeptidase family protein P, partial [Burkholderiaceae bacterium]